MKAGLSFGLRLYARAKGIHVLGDANRRTRGTVLYYAGHIGSHTLIESRA